MTYLTNQTLQYKECQLYMMFDIYCRVTGQEFVDLSEYYKLEEAYPMTQ